MACFSNARIGAELTFRALALRQIRLLCSDEGLTLYQYTKHYARKIYHMNLNAEKKIQN